MSDTLKPRLIKGLHAEYVPAQWLGENTSGFVVYGKNVLVRMDECGDMSSGGVMLPLDMKQRMDEAAETGCIYEMGPEAFRYFKDGTHWKGAAPQVGERVYVEKYAGALCRGQDQAIYRVMDYACIYAGIRTPEGSAIEEAA